MRNTLILIFLFFLYSNSYSQTEPSYQTNPDLSFKTFLSGVKYAIILLTDKEDKDKDENGKGPNLTALEAYLKAMNFDAVGYSTNSSTIDNLSSSNCDIAYVKFVFGNEKNYFKYFQLAFVSCIGDTFVFESTDSINSNLYKNDIYWQTNLKNSMYRILQKMCTYKKPTYSIYNRLKLKRNPTDWNEKSLKENWKSSGVDDYEGIYENSSNSTTSTKYKLGLVKTTTGYSLIYISGANHTVDWDEGELKAKLTPTATANLFKATWIMASKDTSDDYFISFKEGLMYVLDNDSKDLYIKLYPTATDDIKSKSTSGTGTGFAISSTGYIATCNHVVEGATSIKVKGLKGDFTKSYTAKVVVTDANNDLAIIKIDDASFTTLGIIPYTLSSTTSDVGSSIFVMGYPLTATMGDEIKLTNGIISAKSGYQGNITTYQISAAAQPGNSGGPLFDKNGNLIGVVNAKLTGAENANYAIKSTYLRNLIDALPTTIVLPTWNSLTGKVLTEQVKSIKNYVYLIEVN